MPLSSKGSGYLSFNEVAETRLS
ncbi:unnamed protein product [Linum tenue]|uniref:Uncharacterized protein n=1 Tax=Linum tenue TaxID=586396 RepID=A0AAV0IHC8_9ROSI|nr:unnamed protein product [Linum tenue]